MAVVSDPELQDTRAGLRWALHSKRLAAARLITELVRSRMSQPHFLIISAWVRVYTLGSNVTTNLCSLKASQEKARPERRGQRSYYR